MESDATSQPPGEPTKKRGPRQWVWLFWVYMLWNVVGQHIITGAVRWLVAVGGYGFSNAILALVALGGCLIAHQIIQGKYEKLETEGDPEPLPAFAEYVTQAQVSLYMGWFAVILGWGGALAWLIFLGPAPALAVAPVLGTAAVMAGRASMAHARIMDARRD